MNLLAYHSFSPLTLLLIVVLLIAVLPVYPYNRGWSTGWYPPIGLILLVLLIFLLVGCQNPPTPEQAQGWANAAHTVVHGAIQDAKDADTVYNNIKE